jgi:hypothetical protein
VAVSITPDQIVPVAAGGAATFDVLGWTTAITPPFMVGAYAAPPTSPMTFMPTVSLDRAMLTNGVHATLVVGVPPGTPSGSYGLAYVYVMPAGGDSNLFPAVVYTP